MSNSQISQKTNENTSEINNLSHDGRGVISINGKKVLIDGVLPGETVNWAYIKRHRRFDEAKVTDVITPSKDRVEAICPNFLTCGGCSYQHINTDKQLEFKQEILAELLKHIGGEVKVQEWLKPLQDKTSGYRTKARLGVKYVIKKEKILIGFREKASSFITVMDTCKVLHPSLDELIIPLADLIGSCSIFDKVPQVEFAMGDENQNLLGRNIAVVIRHLEDFTSSDITNLLDFAKKWNINLLLQPKGVDSIHAIYGSNNLKYAICYDNGDIKFNINYEFECSDFTQVNLGLNQKMLAQALDLLNLNGSESVLDLFCGLGNFTLPIAKYLSMSNAHGTYNVTGIEGSNEMVARGYANAKLNTLDDINFECMNLYDEKLISTSSLLFDKKGREFDCLILDPPRSGAKELLPLIAKSNIKKVLYVSCDPATFARDVGVLCNEYGYNLEKVGIMDMFTHTKHIETMGLLVKK